MQQRTHGRGETASPFLLADAAPTAAGPEEGIDLSTVFRVLKQNRLRILAYALLFAMLGGVLGFTMTPVYQAQVRLLAEPVESRVSNSNPWVSTALVWLFYETQKEIIESHTVALRVVDQLDLVSYNERKAQEKAAQELKIFDLDWRLWLPQEWRGQDPKPRSEDQKRHQTADALGHRLTVEISKDSQIIVVAYEHEDPQMAAAVADAVADTYRDFGLSSRMSKAREQTDFLNKQLKELEAKVTQAESALQAYQEREGLIDTDSRQQIVTAQLAGLSKQLVEAEAKRNEAEIRYREVQRLQSSGAGYDSIAAVLQSQLVSNLREKQSDLYQKVSELSERYGPKHPKMIAARSELAEATRVLKDEVSKVVGGLQQEFQVAAQQERKVRSMLDQRKGEIQGLQTRSFELSKLERDAENARQVYEQFLSRMSELDVEGDYDVSNVNIIDSAVIPEQPVKPRKLAMLSGGLALGLVFGLFVAFIRDRMDTTFKVLEHAEERLKLVGLGIVPFLRGKEIVSVPERMVETSPHSPFAESINHIRTGILFSAADNPPQAVLITSSTASEGKTTFASNLAQSFSQLGKTLLLEVDLRKPRVSRFFDIQTAGGLTDVVMHPEKAQELIVRVDAHQDLYVLPAGTSLPNPLEFLSSKAFHRLLEALRKKFDYIVLDAPPVLPVSDAVVVSRLVDGVVLALRAENTTGKMAKEAIKRIRAAHVQPLGVVLTQASAKRMAEYGGHYYSDNSYYGQGRHAYGYGRPAESAAENK
jgi:capsular exopolysaccharide synthesis family protein